MLRWVCCIIHRWSRVFLRKARPNVLPTAVVGIRVVVIPIIARLWSHSGRRWGAVLIGCLRVLRLGGKVRVICKVELLALLLIMPLPCTIIVGLSSTISLSHAVPMSCANGYLGVPLIWAFEGAFR